MKTAEEIKKNLAHFTGSLKFYKHWSGCLTYTEGIHYLAEAAESHWLIDAIASYHRSEDFQVWKLKVADNSAVLTMQEDSGCPILVEQNIEYTDFPLDEITLWLEYGRLILISEH